MRSLNLDQLRTLAEVVAQGSFSAAARQLHLTQPAVSLQVRELERRYGVQLIERLGKQAYPTAPGRVLVEAAEAIFRECGLVETAMRRFRDGWVGRVRLGSVLTAMIYRLPPILRRLREEHPGVELVHNNMPTGESIEGIIQNKLDLALVNLPAEHRQLTVTPLFTEAMVAIFPAGTQDLPDAVAPAFVAGQPLLVEQQRSGAYGFVLQWVTRHAELAREPMALGTAETLKTGVASGLGMAIVSEVTVAGRTSEFEIRPLDPPLVRTVALIEHCNKPREPALDIVRNALMTLRTGWQPSPQSAACEKSSRPEPLRAASRQAPTRRAPV